MKKKTDVKDEMLTDYYENENESSVALDISGNEHHGEIKATKTTSSVTKGELIEALEEAIATAKAAALNPVAYKKWAEIVARAKG